MSMYPISCDRTYVNPDGNLAASGNYRHHVTQELANKFPSWMHLRSNDRSIGQQYLSPFGKSIGEVEDKMNDGFKAKFLSTTPTDDIDVLYRTPIPSNINLTDISASGVHCIASPSGYAIDSTKSFWMTELNDLEDFYYNSLPTRVEIIASGVYQDNINSEAWAVTPSGITDIDNKFVDIYGTSHDLTWAHDNGNFLKQDRESLETYASYASNGSGTLIDMKYNNRMLWWIGVDGSSYYLNINSARTYVPEHTTLDLLATFDITNLFTEEPTGIIVDTAGNFWIKNDTSNTMYTLRPRYDYFLLDKNNGYIYFREDYQHSGVFISNT